VKLVVCLWSEPHVAQRYTEVHVDRLRANLRRHTKGVDLLVVDHFRHCFPGYLRILEAFRPEFELAEGEVRVLTGLDTVFMAESNWLWANGRSPYLALPKWPWLRKPTDKLFSNALLAYDERGRQAMWEAAERILYTGYFPLQGGSGSEMAVERRVHENLGSSVLGSPETIVSYPMQISPTEEKWERDLKIGDYACEALKKASVVYFHEEPKQDTLSPGDPVRIEWEREAPSIPVPSSTSLLDQSGSLTTARSTPTLS
jgi:hypothetical protein